MRIGASLIDVSPKCDVFLTGFGNPNRKYLGVHDPIYISCMVIENDCEKIAFVCGDVLGFDHRKLIDVRAEILEKTGIAPQNVLFNASHCHSAPETLLYINQKLGAYVAEYADFFYEKTVEAVVSANADLADGELYWGTAQCYGIGVNRRNMSTGSYSFTPYEDGLRNDEVTLLKAVCNGKIKALFYNFTCHPSVIGFDYASADYPGVCRRLLREKYDCVPAMMQGCCGNIRGRTINEKGDEFRAGTYEDIEHFGTLLAESVARILDAPMQRIDGSLRAAMTYFTVPLADKLSKAQYAIAAEDPNETAFNQWAYQYYVENYDALPEDMQYSSQRIDLGDAVSFWGLPGEVCVEYDYAIKKMLPDRHVAVCGYSNGNPGYICTEEMYAQGGYEPDGSAEVYLITEGFRPENETLILSKSKELASAF